MGIVTWMHCVGAWVCLSKMKKMRRFARLYGRWLVFYGEGGWRAQYEYVFGTANVKARRQTVGGRQ